MPLASIKLRPGINNVQTPTLNEGGWSAASNIRFFEGLPQKDSGFVYIVRDPALGAVRALRAWHTIATSKNYLAIAGSGNSVFPQLKVWDGTTLTNITPSPVGGYGFFVTATIDNWGEFIIGVFSGNDLQGKVWVWDPNTFPGIAVFVPTAPNCDFLFVAAQEQILVCCAAVDRISTDYDPLLLAWSNAGDYTDFIPTAANQAGSFRLPIGSQITAGLIIPGQNLIWTDLALYSMQYIQPPLVWGFQPIGFNCGAVGPHSVGIVAGVTFWMGQNQFFVLTGEGAQQLDCPVWDDVFPNIDRTQMATIACETDAWYGEVGWSVPQTGGSYIYVRLQVKTGAWTASTYHHHTAWIDNNVFGQPIGGHEDGDVDQHDVGYNANGAAAPYSLTSGIIMISEGDETTFVRDLIPDFVTQGTNPTINITVSFYDYPNKAPRVHGPYPVTNSSQVIHPRGRGRGVQFTIAGDDLGSFMRLGNIRYRGQPDGKR